MTQLLQLKNRALTRKVHRKNFWYLTIPPNEGNNSEWANKTTGCQGHHFKRSTREKKPSMVQSQATIPSMKTTRRPFSAMSGTSRWVLKRDWKLRYTSARQWAKQFCTNHASKKEFDASIWQSHFLPIIHKLDHKLFHTATPQTVKPVPYEPNKSQI